MFQYRRKPHEKVIGGLGIERRETISAAQEHRTRDHQPPAFWQRSGLVKQQDRDENERQVIDDVVEPRSVEAGQGLLDRGQPGQHTIGCIEKGRNRQPDERVAITAADDGERGQKRGDDP